MASFIAQSGPQICCNSDVFAQISKPVTALMHQKRGAREHEELAATPSPTSRPPTTTPCLYLASPAWCTSHFMIADDIYYARGWRRYLTRNHAIFRDFGGIADDTTIVAPLI
jgi:hypothetical protein